MSCTDGELRELTGGRWQQCFGGEWVLLPGSPFTGTEPGAMILVDSFDQLTSDAIQKAVNDPDKQVIVRIDDISKRKEAE